MIFMILILYESEHFKVYMKYIPVRKINPESFSLVTQLPFATHPGY